MSTKQSEASIFAGDTKGALQRAQPLAAEVEEGNQEYKFKLTNLSEETLQHR